MKTFYEEERSCESHYAGLGEFYHLWTPENFEIIFTTYADYVAAMNIIAICSKLCPDVRLVSFVIMSNHLHFAIVGNEESLARFFKLVKDFLSRYVKSQNRTVDWGGFHEKHRLINSVEDSRNVIAYIHRNGYVVSDRYTPYTYPWGTCKVYFHSSYCEMIRRELKPMTMRERQNSCHSRMADSVKDLMVVDQCASPLCFCDISAGEALFRNAAQYSFKLSRNVESSRDIAMEIGEINYCTDDEMYSCVCGIAKTKYNVSSLSQLTPVQKTDVARTIHYEYNATKKQIARILKLNPKSLDLIFPEVH